eukprot:s4_g1.t1
MGSAQRIWQETCLCMQIGGALRDVFNPLWYDLFGTSAFRAVPDLCGRVSIVSAARKLVDSARRSCYAGLQLAVANRIGTAARSKA